MAEGKVSVVEWLNDSKEMSTKFKKQHQSLTYQDDRVSSKFSSVDNDDDLCGEFRELFDINTDSKLWG